MKPILAALLAATLLSGCATTLTPARCERALTGLETAAQIVAVLQARGVAVEAATKAAEAISLGQITLAAACASLPVAAP